MPTFTVPNLAALLMAAVEVVILLKICWVIPKQEGRWLRGLPLFLLLNGLLFGFLLLVDYSEWKEGHATQGDARRATSILEFSDFLDEVLQEVGSRDCAAIVERVRIQYENLSADLLSYSGSPLPDFRAPTQDCEVELVPFLEQCRIKALSVELNPTLEHNGTVGAYFQDRLFD